MEPTFNINEQDDKGRTALHQKYAHYNEFRKVKIEELEFLEMRIYELNSFIEKLNTENAKTDDILKISASRTLETWEHPEIIKGYRTYLQNNGLNGFIYEDVKKLASGKFDKELLKYVYDEEKLNTLKSQMKSQISEYENDLKVIPTLRAEVEKTLQALEQTILREMEELLTQGVNPNIQDYSWGTVLCHACLDMDFKIAEFLVKAGADINIGRKVDNIMPLNHAVRNMDIPLIKFLIENGAKPELCKFTLDKLPGLNPNLYYSPKIDEARRCLSVIEKMTKDSPEIAAALSGNPIAELMEIKIGRAHV